jgi:hypothetical protein
VDVNIIVYIDDVDVDGLLVWSIQLLLCLNR